jgi:hypothetical protein
MRLTEWREAEQRAALGKRAYARPSTERETLRLMVNVTMTYENLLYGCCHVEKLTEKAVLIKRGERSAWFPKAALKIVPKQQYLACGLAHWFKPNESQTQLFQ